MEPQSEFLVVQMKDKYIDFMCAKYRIKCVEKNIRVSAANTICHIKNFSWPLRQLVHAPSEKKTTSDHHLIIGLQLFGWQCLLNNVLL